MASEEERERERSSQCRRDLSSPPPLLKWDESAERGGKRRAGRRRGGERGRRRRRRQVDRPTVLVCRPSQRRLGRVLVSRPPLSMFVRRVKGSYCAERRGGIAVNYFPKFNPGSRSHESPSPILNHTRGTFSNINPQSWGRRVPFLNGNQSSPTCILY